MSKPAAKSIETKAKTMARQPRGIEERPTAWTRCYGRLAGPPSTEGGEKKEETMR